MQLMTGRTGPPLPAADGAARPGPAGERPALRWSPAWALEPSAHVTPAPGSLAPVPAGVRRDTTVVLSAGADRRVAIDGVGDDERAAVERWATGDAITTETAPRLLDRLVELGVVVPHPPPGPPTVVAGDPATAADLAGHLTEGGGAGLLVVVRTADVWPTVPPGRLHLGVDLSLHHTVVLGPLVAPGVSACLACLDARAARRWPKPTVPAEPAVRRRLAVVAALVDVQLGLVVAGTSPLVNATMAWNLETGATDRQSLYKLAGCPRCDTGPGDGRVTLPWGTGP